MTEPPPRKPFQIHLSTAIVMMFVAGGLIWANLFNKTRCGPIRLYYNGGYTDYSSVLPDKTWTYPTYGFPFGAIVHDTYKNPYFKDAPITVLWSEVNYLNIFLDIGFALLILFTVWFLLEWLICRHAARK